MNAYYSISAEHINSRMAMTAVIWAEDHGISVSDCYMDEVFSNHIHMVVYANTTTVSELQDYIYSLNGGSYCRVAECVEPEEELY